MEFPETLPRSLLVVTAIVAAVAISLGVKDYFERSNAKPAASQSVQTVVDSNVKTARKKTASAKTRRARVLALEANAPATAEAATDNLGKRLIGDEFAKAGSKAMPATDSPNAARAQAAHDEAALGSDGNNRGSNELDRIMIRGSGRSALWSATCLPLPNSTKLGDVDAPYYMKWAKEYGCEFEK